MIVTNRLARLALFCAVAFLTFSGAAAWSQSAPATESRNWEIYFDLNKADLLPQSTARLDAVVEILKANPASTATVVGHTDNQASVGYNRALAQRRARAAQRYLTRHGIASSRVSSRAEGSSAPKYDNSTVEGKALNRRVEITVDGVASGSGRMDVLTSYVAVLDDSGRIIPNLPVSNFKIFHDGAEREIVQVVYEGDTAPLSIVLALDQSASMQAAMPALKDAAKLFIDNKKPGDLIQIVAFSSNVLIGSQFTTNADELKAAIDRLQAHGYTRLYDAIVHGSLALAALRPPRILIVLTDGKDEQGLGKPGSEARLEQALGVAQRSHVTVVSMGLGDGADHQVLSTIAMATGGANFRVEAPSHLAPLFKSISEGTLRGRYRIDFRTDVDSEGVVGIRSRVGRVIGYK
jgi:VWFA-related protein